MYTELVISTRVKDDPVAVEVLKFMTGRGEVPLTLPEHPLFSADRWQWMLTCSSYYFTPRSMCLFEFDKIGRDWCFISRSDFKNYGDEIAKFIDWLRPYLSDPDEMIGYYRYEESREPTIIYSTEPK
jgi:hypothetical protein